MLGQEALLLGPLVALVLRERSLVALVLVALEQHHGVASLARPRGQTGQLGGQIQGRVHTTGYTGGVQPKLFYQQHVFTYQQHVFT